MSEFLNRIKAQSEMLRVVNSYPFTEELYGLSSGAIERWVISNSLVESSALVLLVKEVAGKLFFLANKSQEQVTNDYRDMSNEVMSLIEKTRATLELDVSLRSEK